MDQSLFIFTLVAFFVLMSALMYCILSTCLGLQMRRSDFWSALSSRPLEGDSNRRRRQYHFHDVGESAWGSDGSGRLNAFEMTEQQHGRAYFS